MTSEGLIEEINKMIALLDQAQDDLELNNYQVLLIHNLQVALTLVRTILERPWTPSA